MRLGRAISWRLHLLVSKLVDVEAATVEPEVLLLDLVCAVHNCRADRSEGYRGNDFYGATRIIYPPNSLVLLLNNFELNLKSEGGITVLY